MSTPTSASVVPENLAWGPGDLYLGTFGAVEPLAADILDIPDDAVWTYQGGTDGGVTWLVDQKYDRMNVDQVVDRVGSRLTQRDLTIATNLAEVTLDNFATALNEAPPTVAVGTSTFEPSTGSAATQPTYRAVLLDAWGPNSKRRRIVVRKILSTEKVDSAYKKDGQTFIPVTFSGHYISDAVKPFKITDDTSA